MSGIADQLLDLGIWGVGRGKEVGMGGGVRLMCLLKVATVMVPGPCFGG